MSDWSSALNVVAKLAPTIASCVGGPLAGGAVTALESVFGITAASTQTVDDRQTALAEAIEGATPAQLAAIRNADQQYAARMAEAGFKDTETLASLAVQDTTSAREMQVATKSLTPPILTALITLGFFSLLALLMFHDVPDANKAIIDTVIGSLGTAWLVCVHFWFGSTDSGNRATDALAQSSPAA